ncbi:alanine-rich protein [Streptomyces chrestomyceticus JCM 4735]|uniref:Alanine-rich protein n=1 Tax=Streptomyces chrestomyceticus JCM 4735 TaxID=1306181 RepID=A0A7U9KSR7_9ACTN|nr:DUF3618 domain-containing protein [Streptomyces chrestomyceticus]GCD34767.1 alanine-rich protein [Streptomyces chrestomyceticus JCM 4735]
MTSDPGKGGTAGPDELRARIELTRQELGDTVAALADKADVKSRAREQAARLSRSTGVRAAAAAGGALLAGALVLRRRNRVRMRPYVRRAKLRTRKTARPLAKAGAKARRACRSKGHH